MPVYIYRCESCGVQFDKHQSYIEEPLAVCPECQEQALRKLIQPVGIVFKGSGFYVTDNRKAANSASSKNGKSEEKSEGKSKSKADSTSEGSSEKSKPKEISED